jgi:hypothetical protein
MQKYLHTIILGEEIAREAVIHITTTEDAVRIETRKKGLRSG